MHNNQGRGLQLFLGVLKLGTEILTYENTHLKLTEIKTI